MLKHTHSLPSLWDNVVWNRSKLTHLWARRIVNSSHEPWALVAVQHLHRHIPLTPIGLPCSNECLRSLSRSLFTITMKRRIHWTLRPYKHTHTHTPTWNINVFVEFSRLYWLHLRVHTVDGVCKYVCVGNIVDGVKFMIRPYHEWKL